MKKEAQIGLGAAMLVWVVVMSIPEVAADMAKALHVPVAVHMAAVYIVPFIILIPCLAIVRWQRQA